jgi:hypothetical protein
MHCMTARLNQTRVFTRAKAAMNPMAYKTALQTTTGRSHMKGFPCNKSDEKSDLNE